MEIKNNKKKNSLLIIGVILLIVAVCMAGIILAKDQTPSDKVSNLDGADALVVDTKYGSLYYPESYEDCVVTKINDDAGYKVEFYGDIDGKDPQHLFDVCFNSDDGDLLGYIDNTKAEEIVNLSIDLIELDFDDSWTDDEMNFIYSMQDERNFVIDNLNRIDNYVEP